MTTTTTKRDHLASLRVNTESWLKFQEIAKQNRMSASLALITLIDLVNEGKISLAIDQPASGQPIAISDNIQSIDITNILERLTALEKLAGIETAKKEN